MSELHTAIREGHFLVADGAIGTCFLNQGVSLRDLPLVVFKDPDRLVGLHLDYLKAGARVLETHTFSANRSKLQALGQSADVFGLNRRAAQLARYARDIFGETVFILGALGPLAEPVEAPLKSCISEEEAISIYREAVAGLLAGGVDGFIVETLSDLGTMRAAVRAIRMESVLPVAVSFAFSPEGTTLYGVTPEAAAEAAVHLPGGPPWLVGANCGSGPAPLLDAVLRMAPITRGHGIGLAAFPNAGQPHWMEGRVGYQATPEYVAHLVPLLRDAGCVLVGGCCGIGPQHIAAMAQSLEQGPAPTAGKVAFVNAAPPAEERSPAPATTGETVLERVRQSRFVVSVELDPPRGINTHRLVEAAKRVAEAGADFVNIGDSPMARVRMSALGASRIIQEEAQISAILHFTTRDRSLMGLQSDLLGAWSLGIRNVLCLTGDPPGLGDYAQSTAVWDIDSIGLVKVLQRFNQGEDAVGLKLGSATQFCLGVGLNPNVESVEVEYERLRQKLDAGAMFIMTQPVYEPWQLLQFLEGFGQISIPILVGVMPLISYRQAQYLNNEVPGIRIPDAVMARMEGQDTPEKGIELALEFIDQIRAAVAGVYLVPSFNRVEPLLPILSHLQRFKSSR